MRLVVLDGYALNPGDLSWGDLEQWVEVSVHDRTPAGEAAARAAGAGLVMTNKTPLPAGVLKQLPDLKYVGVLATGYNIVDVAAAKELGIVVTNIPTYGTESVAQFAIALLLELCHHAGLHSQAVRAGEWNRSPDWSFWKTPLIELAGKTMGIIGYGRIGRHTARIAAALGMRICAYDLQPSSPEPGVAMVTLDELLTQSDVVSLHCPLFPETQGLINSERLGRMKPGAFLINTSRGPLVVEKDVAEALNSGRLGGAAVDVISVEPPTGDSPLFSARNCIVTPHIAWATREARARLMQIAVANVVAFLNGQPVNRVN
ncbi:MAG: D-2-hydroxyacid dehydrogenase [Bryobacterales bacterium]|nr:D-2-hydroxyacid dehydrogenase [Bryobacterales bacterium]